MYRPCRGGGGAQGGLCRTALYRTAFFLVDDTVDQEFPEGFAEVWLNRVDDEKKAGEALEVVTSLEVWKADPSRVDLASANGHWMERLKRDALQGIVRGIVAGTL